MTAMVIMVWVNLIPIPIAPVQIFQTYEQCAKEKERLEADHIKKWYDGHVQSINCLEASVAESK